MEGRETQEATELKGSDVCICLGGNEPRLWRRLIDHDELRIHAQSNSAVLFGTTEEFYIWGCLFICVRGTRTEETVGVVFA